jgi:hypothetical protein
MLSCLLLSSVTTDQAEPCKDLLAKTLSITMGHLVRVRWVEQNVDDTS